MRQWKNRLTVRSHMDLHAERPGDQLPADGTLQFAGQRVLPHVTDQEGFQFFLEKKRYFLEIMSVLKKN